MHIRLRLLGLGLAGLVGTEAMAISPPIAIKCSADGAKLIAPAMSADAVCSRFIGAISGGSAAGSGAMRDGLTVELRFLPQGVAMASVTRFRHGTADPQQRFEMAVSDRGFRPGDIDRLASTVAAGMLHGG